MNIKSLSRYADIVAIPFFALLTHYFWNIKSRNDVETILLIFAISGLVLDVLFSADLLWSLAR